MSPDNPRIRWVGLLFETVCQCSAETHREVACTVGEAVVGVSRELKNCLCLAIITSIAYPEYFFCFFALVADIET